MLVLLILPILIAGYCIQRWHLEHYYNLHKYNGQLLYLKTALLGSFCLFVSFILINFVLTIDYLPFLCFEISYDLLGKLKTNYKRVGIDSEKLPYLTILFANTLFIAWLFSFCSNFWHTLSVYRLQWKIDESALQETEQPKKQTLIEDAKIKLNPKPSKWCWKDNLKIWNRSRNYYIGLIRKKLSEENLVDKLLWESLESSKDLMFHMKDKKVYIGMVTEISDITEVNKLGREISIFPVKSGYRDKDKLTVDITTDYDLEQALFIILQRDEIISLTEYDEKIFETFQKRKVKKRSLECSFKEKKFELKIKL